MDKLDMQTKDLAREKLEQIAEIFPGVITEAEDEEGNITRAVDFDLLRQELSTQVVEGEKERYQLTWPGKRKAIALANLPINMTLRPAKEESADWDTTENVYVEGDNLEALKILQESYLNSVKCIYIDPPYNTGNNFIYRDDFKQDSEEYKADSGQVDEDGNRLFVNNESNGRFHSDWLSMMYPRLKLARNLLREDGVIFISIDDNEVHNLRKICDEIFNEKNCLAELVWDLGTGTAAGHFTRAHEYILVYSKERTNLPNFFYNGPTEIISERAIKKISKGNPASKITFPPGIEYEGVNAKFEGMIGKNETVNIIDGPMIFKDGKLANSVTLEAGWAMRDQIINWLSGRKTFDSKGQKIIRFFFDNKGVLQYEKERGFVNPQTVIRKLASTRKGSQQLQELFNTSILGFPKPLELLIFIIKLLLSEGDIILDFFSGSATTAHAVMQQNAEDGGNRKYIMVQLPEPCEENSEAYKAGYQNISEIGKERIRRAAKKIKEETGADIDYGFRVFKVDSSNMKDVYYHPEEITQQQLHDMVSNIKEDRTSEDLLVQVMLEWDLELSLPMEKREIQGKEVHFVAGNSLVACFEEGVTDDLVKELAGEEPLRVVFRDSSFASDAERINVEELFKMLSPHTEIRVI